MNRDCPSVGFVSVDAQGYWPGGRYYIHHLMRCVALLPEHERPLMRDVWWLEKDEKDSSFDDVRGLMAPSAVVRPPRTMFARLLRKISRLVEDRGDFGDLFRRVGVDALFPTTTCEKPGVPLIYWVPDFQHKRRADLFTPRVQQWFEDNFARKVADAELVLLTSRDAFADFLHYFPQDAAKARLLLCPSVPQSDWFALDPDATARRHGLDDVYFIISNQLTEHKNHLTVFEAVRRLKARGERVQVACTGHSLDYKGQDHARRLEQFVIDHDLGDHIRLLGFLPRAEQMALLRGARAIVHPSLFEGWSSPVEDAKSLGRPLIVSDIPIHREKLDGVIATVVDPNDAQAWADALLAAKANPPQISKADEAAALERTQARALEAGRAFAAILREAVARDASRRERSP